ncbi:3D domain-containing protein [Paenibacillus hodogayensis]|uniref:3D domain-containing protein n=1 Tax=Paenibacillus hodogayensis TaxID=279208 RepID=A0ABV5VRM9_9BACL
MQSWIKVCICLCMAVLLGAATGEPKALAYNSQDEEWAMADNWMYVDGSWTYAGPDEPGAAGRSGSSAIQPEASPEGRPSQGGADADAAAADIHLLQYQVQSGDTLTKISRAFGLTVQDLLAANALESPNRLRVGQRLDIPQLDASWSAEGGEGERRVVQRVLSSTLTAYTAGKESTGKTPSHPAYGITRSGSKAEEGRTVAVDPSIIPLGSTVLIEGIGLRTAEDTGSAIKGARIDIYMNDLNEAVEFGVKKNVKVFVLKERSV